MNRVIRKRPDQRIRLANECGGLALDRPAMAGPHAAGCDMQQFSGRPCLRGYQGRGRMAHPHHGEPAGSGEAGARWGPRQDRTARRHYLCVPRRPLRFNRLRLRKTEDKSFEPQRAQRDAEAELKITITVTEGLATCPTLKESHIEVTHAFMDQDGPDNAWLCRLAHTGRVPWRVRRCSGRDNSTHKPRGCFVIHGQSVGDPTNGCRSRFNASCRNLAAPSTPETPRTGARGESTMRRVRPSLSGRATARAAKVGG